MGGQRVFYTPGQKIGKLIFLKDMGVFNTHRKGLFRCHCGTGFIAEIGSVRKLLTKSCGCWCEKHGLSKTPEYGIWTKIKIRCLDKEDHLYPYYGGRGIKMSKRWQKSVTNFYKDMGQRPGKGYSLERINNNKGYFKSNCKWATRTEQMRNTRVTFKITHKGETKSAAEWGEIIGIDYRCIKARIQKYGWTTEEALTTPIKRDKRYIHK